MSHIYSVLDETGETQLSRTLTMLETHPEGVYNYELATISFRYGAFLHKLRQHGWLIRTEPIKKHVWRYTLLGKDTPASVIGNQEYPSSHGPYESQA